jgi:hypothetical protein
MFEILSSTRIPDTLYVNEISTETATPTVVMNQLPVDVPQGFYIAETAEVTLPVEKTYTVPDNLPTSLYDAVTPVMVEGWLKSTPCFKKHSARSAVCKTCPIQSQCLGIKTEVTEARNEKKSKIAKIEERAKKLGFTLKGIKIPKNVDLGADASFYDCKFEIPCAVSGKPIVLGESFVHIKGFGAVKAETLDILKDYKEVK